jgi:hypothetical protein
MKGYVLKRFFVSLNLAALTDEDRETKLASILSVAPQSTLMANTAIAASVTALTAKGATLKSCRNIVIADAQKLATDTGTCNTARGDFDTELLTLTGLVSTNAKSPADLTGMGLDERPPAPPKPAFAPPDALDITNPKKGVGWTTVSAHVPANSRIRWAVQMSPDPVGANTWTEVYGVGKSRKITGPSGSKVWVRFAMLRRGVPSAWGTPVLVTIP